MAVIYTKLFSFWVFRPTPRYPRDWPLIPPSQRSCSSQITIHIHTNPTTTWTTKVLCSWTPLGLSPHPLFRPFVFEIADPPVHLLTASILTRKPSLKVAPTTLVMLFSFYDLELLSVTVTFEIGLDNIEMNQCAEYLGQRTCTSKVIDWTLTDSHTPD